MLVRKQMFLFASVFMISFAMISQNTITINATVLDEKTGAPIAFANVGFIEKGIGTVSGKDGRFQLKFEEQEIKSTDVFQISTLGYETKKMTTVHLFDFLEKNNQIVLSPVTYALETVILSAAERNVTTLGHPNLNLDEMGYWKDKKALGGEIATRIRIRKKNTKLRSINFHVVENLSDSILLRVNVYNYKNRYPRNNMLASNIYHTVSRKRGIERIDLKPFNIIVNDDVVVSIELIEVFGDNIFFGIAGSLDRGISYTRYVSQDRWSRFENVGMGLYLEASYPVNNTNDTVVTRESPSEISIYWDTSLSMKNRMVEQELDLLS